MRIYNDPALCSSFANVALHRYEDLQNHGKNLIVEKTAKKRNLPFDAEYYK